VVYAWEVIGQLSGPRAITAEILLATTWAIFLLDYVVRLVLADRRGHWFLTHLFDLAVVVLPLFRPLRLLRLITVVTILQRTAGGAFRNRVVIYAASAASLLVFVASLAVLDAERGVPGASITSFGDAIWWSFVSMTTVGYGDYAPVGPVGRLIAVGLMLSGVALLGVVTATLASWIVERVAQQEEDAQAATRGQMRDLTAEIARLRNAIERDAA
jgi:voltage-gated potassium channel